MEMFNIMTMKSNLSDVHISTLQVTRIEFYVKDKNQQKKSFVEIYLYPCNEIQL